MPLRLEARLALGIGSPHPEGMGMSFSYPHGTPRIPGSALKGVLRAAADRVRREGPPPGTGEGVEIDDEVCRQLFGWAPEAGDGAELDAPEEGTSPSQRGHLWVLDAYPYVEGSEDTGPASRHLVELDVVTPHHSGYFTGGGPPVETERPTPVLYPVVAAGALLDVDVLHDGPCVGGPGRCHALVALLWRTVCSSGAIGARSALGLGVVAMREDPVTTRVGDGERAPVQRVDEAVATEEAPANPPELLSRWLGRLEVGGGAEPALRAVLARLAAQFEGNPAGLTELVVVRAVLDAIEGGDEALGTTETLDKLQGLLEEQGLWLPDPPQAGKPYKQRRAKGHELSLRLRALRSE
ncbi:type III-B CRISPR module RAMP protein Cmr6 [Aciditerrimonas ferrireducens]|uniref:type III-B CRISPR module RAMP protein Cmr6 n=1 Tax=Aciditerrimonas ferrireducens TaxID=667306 RepID=UPI002002C5C3|nr:type III-B CRISPR module RAMP protein Cmr6 [Aciditerrimonas ferrireducens]MCK4176166.1 type III-B CRISPR module RAMP protein Cmr6 [Aciditerrimonas ferrireducens]